MRINIEEASKTKVIRVDIYGQERNLLKKKKKRTYIVFCFLLLCGLYFLPFKLYVAVVMSLQLNHMLFLIYYMLDIWNFQAIILPL